MAKRSELCLGAFPQATGRGIYGYEYDRASGRRATHPEQAAVVERIFADFVAGRGVSRIAARLNEDVVPSFGGGKWHPLTVRRILLNETYTGRTVYRRTKVDSVRDPRTGRKHRRVSERAADEWIEVPDATPRIILPVLFERAQALLNDPERKLRGRPTDRYRLRGRVRCLTCDTPMVGQALMRGRYRYYRCRDTYSKSLGGTCSEKYVPRDLLEAAVFDELVSLLTDSERLRDELGRYVGQSGMDARREDLTKALTQVQEQQKKIARLFVNGQLPEDMLESEAGRLLNERRRIEQDIDALPSSRVSWRHDELMATVPALAEHVSSWVAKADDGQLELLVSALEVRVRATRQRALIELSLPVSESLQNLNLVTIEQTSG